VLTAGDEPDFLLFEVDHCILLDLALAVTERQQLLHDVERGSVPLGGVEAVVELAAKPTFAAPLTMLSGLLFGAMKFSPSSPTAFAQPESTPAPISSRRAVAR
jgi:hypothetical protein